MMVKRIFDLWSTVLLFVILFPIFLLIACLVRVTSPGPVIFKQKRMGYRRANFIILKFRTMKHGSGKPFDLVVEGDTRVTKLGRFLRSTHLDELPQLCNVLRGDMSLVGPRPSSVEIAKFRVKEIYDYDSRFEVRPGLTGPVQVSDREYHVLRRDPRSALLLELQYIRNQSLALDLQILCKTVSVVFKKQGI